MQSPADIPDRERPGLVVLPEGISFETVATTANRFPNAVVAGAVLEARRMRGVVWRHGANRVDYRKVGWDGHSDGGAPPSIAPVYVADNMAIGLLICMDVQDPALRNAVLRALREAKAEVKVVCIPAEMQVGAWFVGDDLGAAWHGVNVALSNGSSHYPDSRLRSFLTDQAGRKVAVQSTFEPISLVLTR